MVDTTPFKICVQRAETRQEWDAMQDDYIARSLEAARRIEKLEAALREIASIESYYVSDIVDFARKALEGKDDK
jgi:hypothetical protein